MDHKKMAKARTKLEKAVRAASRENKPTPINTIAITQTDDLIALLAPDDELRNSQNIIMPFGYGLTWDQFLQHNDSDKNYPYEINVMVVGAYDVKRDIFHYHNPHPPDSESVSPDDEFIPVYKIKKR